jgi:RES domain
MAWADAPGPQPDPPHGLARRHLPLRSLHVEWYRVYRCARDPRFFGRTGMFRFDAPAAEYGVLYMARSHEGTFIETFGSVIRAHAGRTYLDEQTVNERCWGRITTERPLRLVDLTGRGLARIGADERLCAGPYAVAQRWSKAFWEHPEAPDGLYYRARHDPSQYSAALFDRASVALSIAGKGAVGAHKRLLARILRRYSIALI